MREELILNAHARPTSLKKILSFTAQSTHHQQSGGYGKEQPAQYVIWPVPRLVSSVALIPRTSKVNKSAPATIQEAP